MPIFTPELIARYAQQMQPDVSASAPVVSPDPDYRAWLHRIGQPALIGGNVADIATTLQAIQSGRAREANPLIGSSPGRMLATKAATTAAEAWLMERLAKDHPKAAFLTALTLGGLGAGLAVHNANVGK